MPLLSQFCFDTATDNSNRHRVTPEVISWIERRFSLEIVTTWDGHHIPLEDGFVCEGCDNWENENNATSVNLGRRRESPRCGDCVETDAFQCGDCRDWFHNGLRCGSNTNDDTICEGCAEGYFTCEGCHGTFHNNSYGEDGRCQDCSHSGGESDLIQSYSTDAPSIFRGKGPQFFGVELEVEANDIPECAERVHEKVKEFAILKEDGSLKEGFEIVTSPCSIEEHKKLWVPFFETGKRGLTSFDTKTCGLHVHASREPLSELTVAKVVVFVNSQANRPLVELIAGRTSGRWAEYKDKKLGTANKTNLERYEAVNLKNVATIEFRIFKGTLKKESFFKALEFCDAIIKFCSPANRTLGDAIHGGVFVNYVMKNKGEFPHLAAFLSAKWLKIETKESKQFGFTTENNQE